LTERRITTPLLPLKNCACPISSPDFPIRVVVASAVEFDFNIEVAFFESAETGAQAARTVDRSRQSGM